MKLGARLKGLKREGLKGGRGTMTTNSRPAVQTELPPGWLIRNGPNLNRQPVHQSLISDDVIFLLGFAMLPLPTKLPVTMQILSVISWIFKKGAVLARYFQLTTSHLQCKMLTNYYPPLEADSWPDLPPLAAGNRLSCIKVFRKNDFWANVAS
jgi:hypothetical protein